MAYLGKYTITHQEHAEDLVPPGRFVDQVTVHFSLPNGSQSYVKLPAENATAQVVDAAIRDKAEHMDEIHKLGDGPVASPEG